MARILPLAKPADKSYVARALAAAKAALAGQGVAMPEEDPEYALYAEILERKASTETEANQRRELYARMENLYYADVVNNIGGADHWSWDEDLQRTGTVHVSVNTPHVYVDIPAALQAIPPYVNYIPDGPGEKDGAASDRREKLMWGWWWQNDVDLLLGEVCQAKGLYGATAVKVYWDADRKCPGASLVESLENLRIGWGSSDFTRKDWSLYSYGLTPQAVMEEYPGLDVEVTKIGDTYMPVVMAGGSHSDPLGQKFPQSMPARQRSRYEETQVEVCDYWYKLPPKAKGGKPEVWNAIYVGNHQVENKRHREFDSIPYVWIPNGKIPGTPYGRPDLYDPEQIFREQDERISDFGQMIEQTVGGQMWQVTGPENDFEPGPVNAITPKRNRVVSPGPGNHLEAIQPYVPSFQADQYITRLEKKLTEITGMSDILLGLVPSGAANSSKAINALLQMYEPRIDLKRRILYRALRELWAMSAAVWERKDSGVRKLIDGNYRIEVKAPELKLRDDMEQAQRVVTLVQNRIWSQRKAMDETGIDNVSDEMTQIREEQTDAALNPQAVMAIIQLTNLLAQMGQQSAQQAQQSNEQSAKDALLSKMAEQRKNASRTQAGPPPGSNSANGPNAGAGTPENTPANATAENGAPALLQSMVNNQGEATGRVLSQQQFGGA